MRSGTASGSSGGWASSVALVLIATLAGCGGDGGGARPRVGKPWHYEVRVTDSAGKPVPASVHLQILFGGAPVGQVGRHRVENGVWSETIGARGNAPFPARARGVRLVFQAVVKALGHTKRANFWIEVR